MPTPASSSFFSNGYQPFLFFHSFHLPHLFIFPLTLSTKTSCLSLIPSQSDPHFLLQSQLLSQTLSFTSMAPKSYDLSTDAFHLTRWNGAVRPTAGPPLTYRSQQHLLKGARAGSVSFSNFSHFSIFPLIFCFNIFLNL